MIGPARVAAILLGVFLTASAARAASPFTESLMQVDGNPTTVLATDLDGDGRKDLAVFYAVSKAVQLRYYIHLAAFLQKPDGFHESPDVTRPLDGGESVAFLAEVDPARPGKELVVVGRTGIFTWRVEMTGGRARLEKTRIAEARSDWFGPDWRGVRDVDLARDLDGDGRDEILLPLRGALEVLRPSKDGLFRPSDRIDVSIYREMGQPNDPGHIIDFIDRYQMKVSEIFPEIFDVDVNDDGRIDLVLTYDNLAATYLRLPDGHFEKDPTLFRSDLTPNRDVLRSAVPPKILTTQAYDFAGDGRADLIMSRSEVEGIKGIVKIQFYPNTTGRFGPDPSFKLREEVLALWPLVGDFNHDGKLDFTFLQTDFGIKEIINFLLTRRVTFNFEFYLWHGDPSFHAKPDRRKSISVKFDLKEGHLSSLPVVDLSHDFNGDGLADFYTPRERDSFSVYFGKPAGSDELFSGDADIDYHVHQSYFHRIGDLNGDKRADIVYWYESEIKRSDLNDKVLVLMSQPPR